MGILFQRTRTILIGNMIIDVIVLLMEVELDASEVSNH